MSDEQRLLLLPIKAGIDNRRITIENIKPFLSTTSESFPPPERRGDDSITSFFGGPHSPSGQSFIVVFVIINSQIFFFSPALLGSCGSETEITFYEDTNHIFFLKKKDTPLYNARYFHSDGELGNKEY
jgi:hypothetical protein